MHTELKPLSRPPTPPASPSTPESGHTSRGTLTNSDGSGTPTKLDLVLPDPNKTRSSSLEYHSTHSDRGSSESEWTESEEKSLPQEIFGKVEIIKSSHRDTRAAQNARRANAEKALELLVHSMPLEFSEELKNSLALQIITCFSSPTATPIEKDRLKEKIQYEQWRPNMVDASISNEEKARQEKFEIWNDWDRSDPNFAAPDVAQANKATQEALRRAINLKGEEDTFGDVEKSDPSRETTDIDEGAFLDFVSGQEPDSSRSSGSSSSFRSSQASDNRESFNLNYSDF